MQSNSRYPAPESSFGLYLNHEEQEANEIDSLVWIYPASGKPFCLVTKNREGEEHGKQNAF
jgi:hypothetical protein